MGYHPQLPVAIANCPFLGFKREKKLVVYMGKGAASRNFFHTFKTLVIVQPFQHL